MSFFNYFSERERGGVQTAKKIKNLAFSWTGPLLSRLHIHPDALSYAGLALLVGVVVWFVSHPYRAVALLALYVINDGLDGAYARYLNRPTQSGAFTDIVADQLGMVVVTLGFIQYRMVDGQIGAYYIMIYLIMITFSVVQNAQKIPMQYIFRSKYILYGIYVLWAFSRVNLAPYLLPVFCLIMTFNVIQSYLRLKRGFYWKYDLPEILAQERKIKMEGGKPFTFWQPVNVLLPATVVALLLFAGAFTQIVSMVERADHSPKWRELGPLPLHSKKELPRAVAVDDDGWLVSTVMPGSGFVTVYKLAGPSLERKGSFRIPWAIHKDHGATARGDRLYLTDRLSRRVYSIALSDSFDRGLALVVGSFDTTLTAPVGCAIIETERGPRMLVTEYMHHYKTLLIDHEKAMAQGTAKNAIEKWYRNAGFARGMAARDGTAYEMNSSLWRDLIYAIDLDRAFQSGYVRDGITAKIRSPKWRCRDIAISENTIALIDGDNPVLYMATIE